MKKSGWLLTPVAFFLVVNFSISPVKVLFLSKLIYFLFLVTLFITLRKFNINQILKTTIGGVSFIVFSYGIIQKFILFPLYLKNFVNVNPNENVYLAALIERIKSGRIFSLFRLPTLYAIICAIFILFIFHYFLKSQSTGSAWNKVRITWAFLLVLGLVNLALTQSFGGIIYLSAGTLAYLLLSRILKFKYLAPILMIFCLFFSLIIALRYPEAKKLEPAALRLSNWHQAARVIDSAPFWGVGLGNYEAVVSYFTRAEEAKSIYAHNFFLQFIAETGVIISFFLVLLLLSLRKKLKPLHPREGEKALYIPVFFILLTYNLIDIGFYFFPVALAGTVILSQIYPAYEYKTAFTGHKYGIVAVGFFFLTIMAIEAFSDNYRVEADILHLQRQYSEAEVNYQGSLRYNPYNFRALIGYASVKLHEQALTETKEYLDRALSLYPDSAAAHHLKSKLELVKGHLWQAFFHAFHAYRKNGLNAEYRNWYLFLEGNLKKHLDLVKQKEKP
ncbi:MAG TPA: O-antigen ligase family protein [Candidatus Kapabacteria bacterium]|nr:O-antigen ligase family protein [Candidatus Kapabacteria bacterium]